MNSATELDISEYNCSFFHSILCASLTPSGILCLKLEITLTDFYFYIDVSYFVRREKR